MNDRFGKGKNSLYLRHEKGIFVWFKSEKILIKKKLLHEKFKDMQLFLKEEKKKHTNQLSELKHGVHFK